MIFLPTLLLLRKHWYHFTFAFTRSQLFFGIENHRKLMELLSWRGNWRTATFLIQSGPSLSLWLSGNISRASKCDWSVRHVRACVRHVNTSVLRSGSNSIPLCAFPPLNGVIKERGKKNLRTSGRMCATAQSGRGNSSSRRSSKLSACPSDPAEARGGSQRRRKNGHNTIERGNSVVSQYFEAINMGNVCGGWALLVNSNGATAVWIEVQTCPPVAEGGIALAACESHSRERWSASLSGCNWTCWPEVVGPGASRRTGRRRAGWPGTERTGEERGEGETWERELESHPCLNCAIGNLVTNGSEGMFIGPCAFKRFLWFWFIVVRTQGDGGAKCQKAEQSTSVKPPRPRCVPSTAESMGCIETRRWAHEQQWGSSKHTALIRKRYRIQSLNLVG